MTKGATLGLAGGGVLAGVGALHAGAQVAVGAAGAIASGRGLGTSMRDLITDPRNACAWLNGGASLVGLVGSALYGSRALSGATPANTFKRQLPARLPGGKTTGLLMIDDEARMLISGVEGPARSIAKGSPGFDIVTRTHVEGHAAALMADEGAQSGYLVIDNQVCSSCNRLLPRMLPEGAILRIQQADGTIIQYLGVR